MNQLHHFVSYHYYPSYLNLHTLCWTRNIFWYYTIQFDEYTVHWVESDSSSNLESAPYLEHSAPYFEHSAPYFEQSCNWFDDIAPQISDTEGMSDCSDVFACERKSFLTIRCTECLAL